MAGTEHEYEALYEESTRLKEALETLHKQYASLEADLSAQKAHSNHLQAENEAMLRTFYSIGDALITTDTKGLIELVNQEAEHLTGWSEKDAQGKPLEQVLQLINAKTGSTLSVPIDDVLKHQRATRLDASATLISRDGTSYHIADSIAPIQAKNGAFTGVVMTFRDVSAQYMLQEKLQETLQQLDEAIQFLPVATGIIDARGTILRINQKFIALFGYSHQEIPNVDSWARKAYPDETSRKKGFQMWNNDISHALKTRESPPPREHRVTCRDGTVKEVEIMLHPGKERHVVTFVDLTEHKMIEKNLKEREERYQNFIKYSSAGIYRIEFEQPLETTMEVEAQVDFIYDHAYRAECNQTFAKMYGGTSINDFTGVRIEDSHGGRHHPVNRQAVREFIRKGYRLENQETKEKTLDGKTVYFSNNTVGIRENGKITRVWGTQIDITARRQMEEQLIEAKEKAQESDRLKSAFLANMSHEIRTPMNGILGFAQMLEKTSISAEQKEEYVEIIRRSGNRMLNTINDLIDISRLEAGQAETFISETRLNDQLRDLYAFFKPEAEQKNLHLSLHEGLPDAEAIIQTDKEKFYRIMTNLIKNAIKYTNKGSITFGYEATSSNLQFYVRDTGIGISKEKQQNVFDRFVQEEDAISRPYEGAGLGLSITKAYVELLGGKIWVHSIKRKGSGFYFTLPL